MDIQARLCTSARGAHCRHQCDRVIKKGKPMVLVTGDGAGGHGSFPICQKCAPDFFKMARKAEKEFKKLMDAPITGSGK